MRSSPSARRTLLLLSLAPLLVVAMVAAVAASRFGAWEPRVAENRWPLDTFDAPLTEVASLSAVPPLSTVSAVEPVMLDIPQGGNGASIAPPSAVPPLSAVPSGWRSLPIKMRYAPMDGSPAELLPLQGGGVDWVLQNSKNDYKVTCVDEAIAYRFPPVAFAKQGDTVTVSMMWTTLYPPDRTPPGDACPIGSGVDETNTRCMFGTGDFRIGLLESKADGELDRANGVQFRVSPHMSAKISAKRISIPFKNRVPCDDPWLVESSTGDNEPHTNASMLVREAPNAGQGLGHVMDDQCSTEKPKEDKWNRPVGAKSCGFREGPAGKMSGPGAQAPYNAPFPVELELTRGKGRGFTLSVIVNKRVYKQSHVFQAAFDPRAIDSLTLTFTNTWRVYGTLRISEVVVK